MSIPAWKLNLITVAQVLCYIIMVVPLRLLARAKRDIDPEIIRLRRGSLVVANHQWFLDPFMVLAHVPFMAFLLMLPIRFPVKHELMKRRWQWLRLVGIYDIGNTPREKMIGLYRTRELLRQQVTVFLFPEGRVNRSGQVGELQRGIEFLMTENTPVMFVRMQGFHHRDIKLLREPHVIEFIVAKSAQKITIHDIARILKIPSPEF